MTERRWSRLGRTMLPLGCVLGFTFAWAAVGCGGDSSSNTSEQTSGGMGGEGTGGGASGGTNNTGGTGGGTNNTGGTGGDGSECTKASDCPGTDTACSVRVCTDGLCFTDQESDGTVVEEQTAGDCKQRVCENGKVVSVADDSDVLDDDNECTDDACDQGDPTNTPVGQGSACSDGAGVMCNADGECVECVAASDCGDDACEEGQCVPVSCVDGAKNGDETDVDCGGPDCSPCGDQLGCEGDGDCESGTCTSSVCQGALCTDSIKNGDETDVDCGGSDCPDCATGLACVADTDCIGGDCSGTVCLATCTDTVKNTDETDVDCGGSCDPCSVGQACEAGDDCASGVCTEATCAQASCTDGVRNGTETGTDCGGSCGACEAEPNDTCGAASTPITGGSVVSAIDPVGDVDFYSFYVPAVSDVQIEVFAGAAGACDGAADTHLTLLGPDCTTQLANNDDSGPGFCSMIDPAVDLGARRLAPGTYHLKVVDFQSNSVIPVYRVIITTKSVCGNGVKESSETCDDGNTTTGDGCAADCRLEPTLEVEANNTCATASGPVALTAAKPAAMFGGAITPAADQDYFSFTVPALSDVRIETFDANGPGTCAGMDTEIQLFDSTCAALGAVKDQGGVGNCSKLDPANDVQVRQLPAGTYRVKVNEYQNDATISGYRLQVSLLSLCGNGVVEGSEECDGGASCTAACTKKVEAVCNDGLDDDSDGAIDCLDSDCALGCSLPACATGQKLLAFSNKTAKSIPDQGSSTSSIAVTATGTIQRASARVNITHAWDEDLDISLRSPQNVTRDLSSDNGGDGDNYTNTAFADSCATNITAGTPPYTGCFLPEQPLSVFNGQSATGTWSLIAADDDLAAVGTLVSWELSLCVSP